MEDNQIEENSFNKCDKVSLYYYIYKSSHDYRTH